MIELIQRFSDYQKVYEWSTQHPELFWSAIAKTFTWQKKWDTVVNWNFTEPTIKWFEGGVLNITENALDRHIAAGKGNQNAIIWEPNDPHKEVKTYTYAELLSAVSKVSNAFISLGIKKGDRICLYMPMIPELCIATLACARIGAVHSIIFAGFSAQALADRINDAEANLVITTDAMERGSKQLSIKPIIDEAIAQCACVKNVLVFDYLQTGVKMESGRDIYWHNIVPMQSEICNAEPMQSEDMLFILYTSGSTGKPKGVVHTCGGYMVYTAYSFKQVFQYQEGEVYWCTADIGWITGHSYIVYGPLLNGATTLLFEGIPTYPDAGRFWQVCEKHKVHIFYTAPTAIRALMAYGTDFVNAYDLSTLRVLGSVGEPINEEAWKWYHKHIGKGNCPIVDTWWQTETGGIMISGLGDISPSRPAHAGLPLPGIQPILLDQQGKEIINNEEEGYLCIKYPWPSMLRTTYKDHERCRITYFANYPNYYFTGDGAKRDANGLYRIIGRVDDVINVSGHRFGTAEIENAINQEPRVIESAVVAFPHDIKGQAIYAFVVCEQKPTDDTGEAESRKAIKDSVSKEIGKIAIPDKIQFASGLPKTRSGKIMRRILRKIAEGDAHNLGDTSTLLDPEIVNEIVQGARALI